MSCCETVWGEKNLLFSGGEERTRSENISTSISNILYQKKQEERRKFSVDTRRNFVSHKQQSEVGIYRQFNLKNFSTAAERERYVKVDTDTSSRAALTDNENRSNLVKMWNYSRENWIIPRGGKKGIERLLTSYIGERFEIKQRRKMKIGGEESSSVKCRIRKFRQIFLPFLILSVVLLDTQTKVFLVKNGKS